MLRLFYKVSNLVNHWLAYKDINKGYEIIKHRINSLGDAIKTKVTEAVVSTRDKVTDGAKAYSNWVRGFKPWKPVLKFFKSVRNWFSGSETNDEDDLHIDYYDADLDAKYDVKRPYYVRTNKAWYRVDEQGKISKVSDKRPERKQPLYNTPT
jgi:hypothetical protein